MTLSERIERAACEIQSIRQAVKSLHQPFGCSPEKQSLSIRYDEAVRRFGADAMISAHKQIKDLNAD